jgi:hypothetical protein
VHPLPHPSRKLSSATRHRLSHITLGVQGGPLCALVHQYDRHWRLVKLADALYNGVDKDHLYVKSAQESAFNGLSALQNLVQGTSHNDGHAAAWQCTRS